MLATHLKSAIKDIEELIQLTHLDIKNIKAAKHNELKISADLKENLIASFETKKRVLNQQLTKLVEQNSNKSLNELLTNEESELLDLFKKNLTKLKRINKEYAKYVTTISEFFNSFCNTLFLHETDGYKKSNPKPASLLRISA